MSRTYRTSNFPESPCRKPCALSASNVTSRCDENRRNLLIHCVVFLDHHKLPGPNALCSNVSAFAFHLPQSVQQLSCSLFFLPMVAQLRVMRASDVQCHASGTVSVASKAVIKLGGTAG
jgi:hypothetical protein